MIIDLYRLLLCKKSELEAEIVNCDCQILRFSSPEDIPLKLIYEKRRAECKNHLLHILEHISDYTTPKPTETKIKKWWQKF